jgi:hypothetical protein
MVRPESSMKILDWKKILLLTFWVALSQRPAVAQGPEDSGTTASPPVAQETLHERIRLQIDTPVGEVVIRAPLLMATLSFLSQLSVDKLQAKTLKELSWAWNFNLFRGEDLSHEILARSVFAALLLAQSLYATDPQGAAQFIQANYYFATDKKRNSGRLVRYLTPASTPEAGTVVSAGPPAAAPTISSKHDTFSHNAEPVYRHVGTVHGKIDFIAVPQEQRPQDTFSVPVQLPLMASFSVKLEGVRSNRKITMAAYSPTGELLVGRLNRGPVRLWDTFSGELIQTLSVPREHLVGLGFNQNQDLVFALFPKEIRIWDVEEGQLIREGRPLIVDPHWKFIDAALSPQGDLLAMLLNDNQTVALFDWGSDTPMDLTELPFLARRIYFTADRNLVFEPLNSGQVNVYSPTGLKALAPIGSSREISTMGVDPTGKYLALADKRGKISLFRQSDGAWVRNLKYENTVLAPPQKLYFSPDGLAVAGYFYDWHLRVWEVESGDLIFERRFPGNPMIQQFHAVSSCMTLLEEKGRLVNFALSQFNGP